MWYTDLNLLIRKLHMKLGRIYKITNTINGKIYIGQTVQCIRKRWYDHVSQAKSSKYKSGHFQRAILKYGREAFKVELVEDNVPNHLLDEREAYYITEFNSYLNGYNSTSGGQKLTTCAAHYVPTKDHRTNMSKAKKGKSLNWSEESLEAVRQAKLGANNPNFGRKAERVVCGYCNRNVAKNIYVQYHGAKCKHRVTLES